MQRDLNSSTARHLTSIPGIDNKLAEGIIRFRNSHGRYQNFDELWQVSGMNRSMYQLLRRHFCVYGEKPPAVGSKLPYARLSLTESMMDFVCQGTAKSSSKSPSQKQRKTSEAVKVPDGKCVVEPNRSKPPRKSTGGQSSIPITRLLIRKTKGKPELGFYHVSNKSEDDDKVTPTDKPANPPILAKNDVDDALPCTLYQNEIELLQSMAPTRVKKSLAPSPEKPSVTVETSPSGNNINLSCNIDKRTLGNATSMAFQLKDNNNSQSPALAQVTAKGKTWRPAVNRIRKNSDPEEKMEQSPEDSTSEYHTATPGVHPALAAYFPALDKSGESPLVAKTSASTVSSGPLSQENVLLFERQNTLNDSTRQQLVEAWVNDVNRHQQINSLLKRRDNKRVPGDPNSKFWTPPVEQPGTSKQTFPPKIINRPSESCRNTPERTSLFRKSGTVNVSMPRDYKDSLRTPEISKKVKTSTVIHKTTTKPGFSMKEKRSRCVRQQFTKCGDYQVKGHRIKEDYVCREKPTEVNRFEHDKPTESTIPRNFQQNSGLRTKDDYPLRGTDYTFMRGGRKTTKFRRKSNMYAKDFSDGDLGCNMM